MVGYEREILQLVSWLNSDLGFQFSTYGLPSHLKPIYGDHPATFAVFLRLRPKGNMQMQH
ncbi:MAG: hypothetical protein DMG13_16585 [Acidobacteria bacterium]|nr:MAG: hypothetical protein DMG13_16585 [Acidobacteriota bacterium]